jgi:predicted RNA binding protein YcfA (HicA-like mRNA interferase family)
MKSVSGKRRCKILESRGWTRNRIRGSHHVYERPDSPLSVSIPVHGNRDLPTGTQKGIMRDAGSTDADL